MVESQVKEERLARDRLEVGRKVDQVGMLAHEGRVQAERLQAIAQRLESDEDNVNVLTRDSIAEIASSDMSAQL